MKIDEQRVATERANKAALQWMMNRARPLNPIVRLKDVQILNTREINVNSRRLL